MTRCSEARSPRRPGVALVLGLASLCLGSACKVPTQILVNVIADPEVRARTRSVCFSVNGGFVGEGSVKAMSALIPEQDEFPLFIPTHPGPGGTHTQLATFLVEACEGEDCCDGDSFVHNGLSQRFTPHARTSLTIPLTEDCIEVECAPELTCVEGQCVDYVLPPGATEIPLPSDRQPAVCSARDRACVEHPRPGPILQAACADPDLSLISGNQGILALADGVWVQEAATTADVHGLVCLGGGRAVAVGQGGLVLERAPDGTWSSADEGATETLWAVAAGGGEVWAAGGGAVLRRMGDAWLSVSPPPRDDADLLMVSPDGTRVWVGSSGSSMAPGALFELSPPDIWTPVTLPPGVGWIRALSHAGAPLVQGSLRLYTETAPGVWDAGVALPCGVSALASLVGLPSGEALGGGAAGGVVSREPSGALSCVADATSGANFTGAALRRDGPGLQGTVVTSSGSVYDWDGASLRRTSTRVFAGDLTDVTAVAGSPHGFLAVGADAGVPVIVERIDELGRWRLRAVPPGVGPLRRVLARAGLAVAVGDGVVETRFDALGWQPATLPGVMSLHSLSERGGRWIAGGDGGALLERVGDSWRSVSPALVEADRVTAVAIGADGTLWAGTGASDGEARCRGGFGVHALRGGSWERLAEVDCSVGDIAPRSNGTVWVAAGETLVIDDAAVTPLTIPGAPDRVERLWLSGDEVLATMGESLIVRRPGPDFVAPRYLEYAAVAESLDDEGRRRAIVVGPFARIQRVGLEE